MRKGFTLVELLAVLVIITIIGLIAVPIVSGIVIDAKRKAAEEHVNRISKQASNYYRQQELNDRTITSVDLTSDEIKYDGKKPEKGVLIYDEKGNSSIVMYYNGYCLRKDYEGKITSEKVSNEECDVGDFYVGSPRECFTFTSSTGTITKYNKNNPNCPADVVIPNKIDGVFVKHIGPGSFIEPTAQTCVNSEGNSESVGVNYVNTGKYKVCMFGMMNDTKQITSVDFSKATELESIDYASFMGVNDIGGFVNNITSITFGEINKLKSIGTIAFGWNQLSSVIIPSSVEVIEAGAFLFNQLTSLEIIDTETNPSNLTTIGGLIMGEGGLGAFTYNQLSSVTIPASVETIGLAAFALNSIDNLTLPNKYIDIECFAFVGNPLTNVTNPYGLNLGDEC